MKHSFHIKIMAAGMALLTASSALATNGYYSHGLGVKNKGMAGAGTAMPQEAIAVSMNPASSVLLGDHFELGIALFSPRRAFSASDSLANGQGGAFTIAPGDVSSGSKYFPIPYVARSWKRSDTTAYAVSFYGRGGMNTNYNSGSATLDPDGPGPAPVMTLPGAFGGGSAGVNLMQAFADFSYSHKQGPLAMGGSVVLVGQSFKAKGLANFTGYTEEFAASGGTVFPTNLTNNGTDYSFGAGIKLGVIYEVSDRFNVALSLQSRMKMSNLDKYSNLFAEQGAFDIPSAVRAGFSYKLTDTSSLHYDIEHTSYSEVDSVGNPIQNLFACPTAGGTDLSSCLGGDRGAGFGWDDMTTHKIGYQWQTPAAPDWTFRVGYSRGSQPIERDQILFNMLAPGVIEQHFTTGFTHKLDSGEEYSMNLMYAPTKKVTGQNNFDPTQTIELRMHQFELEFAYSW
jgi:long-chain fatty acid transport protein